MKQVLSSEGSHKMKHHRLEEIADSNLCQFIDICLKRKELRDGNKYVNCFIYNVLNCPAYKTYEDYGEQANQLGI